MTNVYKTFIVFHEDVCNFIGVSTQAGLKLLDKLCL